MEAQTLEATIRNLADRAEICDVIGRYCFGMDTRDWETFRTCWADEIELDMPGAWGNGSGGKATISADDWVATAKAFMANMPHSQHLKMPISFEIKGDAAVVICLMQGKHWMPNENGEPISTVVGYYRDHYVRTHHGWRQRAFQELVHWHEGNWHVLNVGLTNMMSVLMPALRKQNDAIV